MHIWHSVQGEGSKLGNHSRARGSHPARGEGSEHGIYPGPRMLPPTDLPHAGVETGWRWGDAGRREIIEVRLLWLFIGVLSRADWIGGVITDDELAVLNICACSSQNVLIKHHLLQSVTLFTWSSKQSMHDKALTWVKDIWRPPIGLVCQDL